MNKIECDDEGLYRLPANDLLALCRRALSSVGVCDDDANLVANTLVRGDAEGAASHGISRLPSLLRRVQAGLVTPEMRFEILRESDATASVDVHSAIGQVVADRAIQLAIEKTRRIGIGAVSVRNSTHLGRAGHAATTAAETGFIGIVASNASPRVVPYAGARPVLGNNPWAMAVPTTTAPLVIDMATSVVAAGKIRVAKSAGSEIPLGWATDSAGHPTTSPDDALNGALLAIGGHKGWAISLAVDALTGVLSGGSFGDDVSAVDDMSRSQHSSQFFLVLDPARFLLNDDFEERMDQLSDRLGAAGGPNGRLPGERSRLLRKDRLSSGVPVSGSSLLAIRATVLDLKILDNEDLNATVLGMFEID